MLLHALLKHIEAEGLGTEGGSLFLGRAPQDTATGSVFLPRGGTRRDYLRARFANGKLTIFDSQDSGRTFPLAAANALVIREIGAPAVAAGAMASYIDIA